MYKGLPTLLEPTLLSFVPACLPACWCAVPTAAAELHQRRVRRALMLPVPPAQLLPAQLYWYASSTFLRFHCLGPLMVITMMLSTERMRKM